MNDVWLDNPPPNKRLASEIGAPSKSLYYVGILNLYKVCIQIDGTYWLNYYRIAHAYRKMSASPVLVMKFLKIALEKAPKDLIVREYDHCLEIIYKGCSYLLKLVQKQTLDFEIAKSYLLEFLSLHQNFNDAVQESCISLTNTDLMKIFVTVFELIQKLDKKKWIHKAYFRLAWIQDKVLNDPAKAKDQIISFLNAHSKTGFRRIWRTELEL